MTPLCCFSLRRSRLRRKDCTRWGCLCLWGNLKGCAAKKIVISSKIDSAIFVAHLSGMQTHTPHAHDTAYTHLYTYMHICMYIYICIMYICIYIGFCFCFLAFHWLISHICDLQGLTFKNTDVYETIKDSEKPKQIEWTAWREVPTNAARFKLHAPYVYTPRMYACMDSILGSVN